MGRPGAKPSPFLPPAPPSFTASALVLRLTPQGESDIRLDLFTRERGRLAALAKGGKRSRRRFTGLLLLAHYLEVELRPPRRGGELLWLDGAQLVLPFLGLRQDFRRFLAASPVLELLLRATAAGDPQPAVLELALLSLSRLEQADTPLEMLCALVVFLTRLLRELGYGLELRRCLRCGGPALEGQAARLSLEGGLVCGRCGGGRGVVQVPAGLVRGLAAAASLEPAALARLSFTPGTLRPALEFLSRFWRQVTGRELPSLAAAAGLLESTGTAGKPLAPR